MEREGGKEGERGGKEREERGEERERERDLQVHCEMEGYIVHV